MPNAVVPPSQTDTTLSIDDQIRVRTDELKKLKQKELISLCQNAHLHYCMYLILFFLHY